MRRLTLSVVAASLLALAAAPAAGAARRPDLSVRAFAVPVESISPGGRLSLRVTVANTGTARARASRLAVYLSRDARRSREDVRLATITVTKLRARRAVRALVRPLVPAALAAGDYRVLACADERRAVRERSERNNCRAGRAVLKVVRVVSPGPGLLTSTTGSSTEPGPLAASAVPASVPDADGDGVPDAQDCAPANAGVHPGAPDAPDAQTMVDANCDGVDGDAAHSVFVATTGNDANPGTRERPKLTLAAATAAAKPAGRAVLVAEGTYAEELPVLNGVSVYGGYARDWSRSRAHVVLIAPAFSTAARASFVTDPTVLQLLTLQAADATTPSTSSYGLLGTSSSGLVLESVTATAGRGGNGDRGASGQAGTTGGRGADGAIGDCDDLHAAPGGAGGSSPVSGREGGRGGDGGHAGVDRAPAGGKGGGTFGGSGGSGGLGNRDPGTAGAAGQNGFTGNPGANGTGGSGGFMDIRNGWVAAWGGRGTDGTAGYGGGGGGGGGGQNCSFCDAGTGNGGGGGGGGGTGGHSGAGGDGGGGSFGIALVSSGGAILRDVVAKGADAGNGGTGGSGGLGGPGGDSGLGAARCTDQIGAGGRGGRGGAGGQGGNGGGGAGGWSAGLITNSGANVEGGSFTAGFPGRGGPGPNSGADGKAAPVLSS